MRSEARNHERAFTVIELLTVVAILGILAALLLPVLEKAKERANRVTCASNMKQIGAAIMLYADDYQDHIPPVYPVVSSAGNYTNWAQTLVSGRYATSKIFICPNDCLMTSQRTTSGVLSYGLCIANSRLSTTDPTQNDYWIAGSRLTCPYLKASEVAMVSEYYSSTIQPTMRAEDYWSYVTGPKAATAITLFTAADGYNHPPLSKHEIGFNMKGNFLFMDAHVEYVEHPEYRPRMFPKLPTGTGAGTANGIPCP